MAATESAALTPFFLCATLVTQIYKYGGWEGAPEASGKCECDLDVYDTAPKERTNERPLRASEPTGRQTSGRASVRNGARLVRNDGSRKDNLAMIFPPQRPSPCPHPDQPFRRLVVAQLNRQINALQHAVPAHGRPYVWRTRSQIDGTLMPRTAFLAAAKRNATTVVRPPGKVSITAGTLKRALTQASTTRSRAQKSRKRRRQNSGEFNAQTKRAATAARGNSKIYLGNGGRR